VLLNLFLGGSKEPIQVVDGEAREITIEPPVRLADAAIRALLGPELSSGQILEACATRQALRPGRGACILETGAKQVATKTEIPRQT
jgi:hypothetical protein